MNANVPQTADNSAARAGPLAALLTVAAEAQPLVAEAQPLVAEAQPLVAEHRPGRIVINFSGGDKVRIETARLRDVSVGPPAK